MSSLDLGQVEATGSFSMKTTSEHTHTHMDIFQFDTTPARTFCPDMRVISWFNGSGSNQV